MKYYVVKVSNGSWNGKMEVITHAPQVVEPAPETEE